MRHLIGGAFLAALLVTAGIAAAADPAPPNVLFIAVDDLRTALGCYGDPLARTPHIDRFAATARRFDRAYVQQAVCGPSRTALLTGRLPDTTRVWHNRHRFRDAWPGLVTMPQLFMTNGYHAASLGKVFSGDERELDPASWSEPEVLRQKGWRNYVLRDDAAGKGAAWEAADVPDDGYADGRLARLAVEKLGVLNAAGRPFFLAVGFSKPHLPFNAPKRYWDLHDPARFELLGDVGPVAGVTSHAFNDHRELGGYRDMPADERVEAATARTLRHGYYACVSYVDALVGMVLAELDRLGIADRTVVVLWGDHGYSLGERGRWCKATNFERDTRVPLLIRTPGLPQPGRPAAGLVEAVDVFPTLAAVAGLEPPAGLDGRSLVPILDDPRAPGRDAVLSQFARPFSPDTPDVMGYSLRTPTHRYTRWVSWPDRCTVADELYDYDTGPSVVREGGLLVEQQNIAADPAHAATRDALAAELDGMLARRVTVAPEGSTVRPAKRRKKDR